MELDGDVDMGPQDDGDDTAEGAALAPGPAPALASYCLGLGGGSTHSAASPAQCHAVTASAGAGGAGAGSGSLVTSTPGVVPASTHGAAPAMVSHTTAGPVIVLDGANIAWTRGKNEVCAPDGIVSALRYFRGKGFQCFAFVPAYYVRSKPRFDAGRGGNSTMQTDTVEALQRLVEADDVVLTPPQSDDDKFIVTYAADHDGFVVSNDMFRNHIAAQATDAARERAQLWVKARVVPYTFVGREFVPDPTAMRSVMHAQFAAMQAAQAAAMHAQACATSAQLMAGSFAVPVAAPAPASQPVAGYGAPSGAQPSGVAYPAGHVAAPHASASYPTAAHVSVAHSAQAYADAYGRASGGADTPTGGAGASGVEVDPKDAQLFALSPEVMVEEVAERRAHARHHRHRDGGGRSSSHRHGRHHSRREAGSPRSKSEIVAHVKRLLMPAYTGKFVDKDTFKDIARRISKWQTDTFRDARDRGDCSSVETYWTPPVEAAVMERLKAEVQASRQ